MKDPQPQVLKGSPAPSAQSRSNSGCTPSSSSSGAAKAANPNPNPDPKFVTEHSPPHIHVSNNLENERLLLRIKELGIENANLQSKVSMHDNGSSALLAAP